MGLKNEQISDIFSLSLFLDGRLRESRREAQGAPHRGFFSFFWALFVAGCPE